LCWPHWPSWNSPEKPRPMSGEPPPRPSNSSDENILPLRGRGGTTHSRELTFGTAPPNFPPHPPHNSPENTRKNAGRRRRVPR
jgi:hypothetical protein